MSSVAAPHPRKPHWLAVVAVSICGPNLDGLTSTAHICVRYCIVDVTTALHSSTCRTLELVTSIKACNTVEHCAPMRRKLGTDHSSLSSAEVWRVWKILCFGAYEKFCVSLSCSFMHTFRHCGAWGQQYLCYCSLSDNRVKSYTLKTDVPNDRLSNFIFFLRLSTSRPPRHETWHRLQAY